MKYCRNMKTESLVLSAVSIGVGGEDAGFDLRKEGGKISTLMTMSEIPQPHAEGVMAQSFHISPGRCPRLVCVDAFGAWTR